MVDAASLETSPLAPARFPALPAIDGVALYTAMSAERYRGRHDCLLAVMEAGTAHGGVFTLSTTASPSVLWCREQLLRDTKTARALVVNAGTSNAFTGASGHGMVRKVTADVAAMLGMEGADVFIGSTGVIGQVPRADVITAALAKAYEAGMDATWEQAAKAICTTDTFPKGTGRTATIHGVPVTINGIAKGSGMIAPNMATMLAYLFTDACIPSAVLQRMLVPIVEETFNSITVDSDTSTSDSVMLFATHKAAHTPITESANETHEALDDFQCALHAVCLDLAHQVVRDGEGAKHFITVTVEGTDNTQGAKTVAFAIANSPLVKTAIAGKDANWGRIAMAVGKSGIAIDQNRIGIHIGGIAVARSGCAVANYDDALIKRHLQGQNIDIHVSVGSGAGKATVWTCDLTHEYISINADYRS